MLGNQKFYHQTTRKLIIAFGSMFNNIMIDRKDDAGNLIQTMKIPLSYGPKQKYLARIQAQPDLENRQFEISLPRMAFDITGFKYDPMRKLPPLNQAMVGKGLTADTQYSPVPYDVTINLYVMTKNQDDGLQIVEQIFPFFNPAYNLNINDIPELGIKRAVPVTLDSVQFDDVYEGDFSARRVIIWTLSFTLKINFSGPISSKSVIKSVTANMHPTLDTSVTAGESITITVDPITANKEDNWTFITEFDNIP